MLSVTLTLQPRVCFIPSEAGNKSIWRHLICLLKCTTCMNICNICEYMCKDSSEALFGFISLLAWSRLVASCWVLVSSVRELESFPGWPLPLRLLLLTRYCAVGNMTRCFGIFSRNPQAFVGRFSVFCPSSAALWRAPRCSYFRRLLLGDMSPHPVLLGSGCSLPWELGFSWIFGAQTEECNTAGFAELIFIILIGLIVQNFILQQRVLPSSCLGLRVCGCLSRSCCAL